MLPEYLSHVTFTIPAPSWINDDWEKDWGLWGIIVSDLLDAVNVEKVQAYDRIGGAYFKIEVAIVDGADLMSHQVELLDIIERARPKGE